MKKFVQIFEENEKKKFKNKNNVIIFQVNEIYQN